MARSIRWSVAALCLMVGIAAGPFLAGPFLKGQAPAAAPVVPKEMTSYRDVVKKILPAVVSIEARAKPKARKSAPFRRAPSDDADIPEEFRKFFEGTERGPLEIPDPTPGLGFGSGFIVDPKGVILTNHHVVDGADQVVVHLSDGQKFISKEVRSDRKTDLAIVRIDAPKPLPYVKLGDSSAMEIGDRVLAVGAPFGLTGSVTSGIISAKGRNGLNMNMYEDFLQTDAAINPGNSGGPLVNLEGKVIGINSVIKTTGRGWQGVGLAISSNVVKPVMDQLLKNGVVRRGYLGVQIKDVKELDPQVASRLGLKGQAGVVVNQVFDKSPAAKSGLQEGDVITGLAGKAVTDSRELQEVVKDLPLHKPVDLNVMRDGKSQMLHVMIEEQPEDYGYSRPLVQRRGRPQADAVPLSKFGLTASDLTAEQLGFKTSAVGALVTSVEPDGLAAEAGLRRGTLITKVDKAPIKSAAELKDALEKASLDKGVLLQVQSPQGGTGYVMLQSASEK